MKVRIEKSSLAKALSHIQRVVERRTTIPILSNVLLSAETGGISLRATDLDLEVLERLPATVEQGGAVTVPAHLFYDIVRKLPEDGEVSLEATPETLHLKAGRAKFSLQILPAADFPDLSAGDMPTSFEISAQDLKRLIDKTDFAISTEETRYYLTGIYLSLVSHETGTLLRAVATDGHRLAMTEVFAPTGLESMEGVIVPRKAIAEIRRLLDEGSETLKLSISDVKIQVEFGAIRLISKLIDGTFPDYERVIPKGNPNHLTLNCQKFLQAVDLVSTLSSDRGRAVKCALQDDKLVLTVTNPDSGLATLDVEATYKGDPLEIGFNAKYLLDIASEIKSDSLSIALADPGAPALFTTEDDAHTLYVLMPMRV